MSDRACARSRARSLVQRSAGAERQNGDRSHLALADDLDRVVE
jgi:hypothetical protein